MKITALIMALDESERITDCLKHLKPHVDYIIVVDGGSTDDTYTKAASIADRVIKRERIGHWCDEKNYIETLVPTDTDWILHVDVDEAFHDRLMPEIKTIIKGVTDKYPETMAFRFPRANFGMNYYDSLEQCLYTRLTYCSLEGTKNCPLLNLISKDLKKIGRSLGKNIIQLNLRKTEKNIGDFTVNGVTTLIQNIGKTSWLLRDAGERLTQNYILKKQGVGKKQTEINETDNAWKDIIKEKKKDLKAPNNYGEKETKRKQKPSEKIGEIKDDWKLFFSSEANAKNVENLMNQLLNFIIESHQTTIRIGCEETSILKNCSYCVLTAIEKHIDNLKSCMDFPDYQVRLLKKGSGYTWINPLHSIPAIDGVPVDRIQGKCMTMLDLPIWHLPRRTDIRRPWWSNEKGKRDKTYEEMMKDE